MQRPEPESVGGPFTMPSPTPVGGPKSSRGSVGQKIGPYSLLEFLGSGGFGEVWLAERDSEIARNRLAVKLPLHSTVDLDAIRREAEVWVRAGNHPNILPIFEAGIYDSQVLIVSEYAPDGSLHSWLTRHGGKAPSVEAAVEMTMSILAGLEHLHVRQIVHRDLKPANILMQGESPRIADFGLARSVDPGSFASAAAGTPAYMAPEAFDGHRSVQTDLWSVGVILHQLIGGSLPFPAGDLMKLVKSLALEEPQSLSDTVPEAIRAVVLRALHKDPASRFRSSTDMRASLRDSLRQLDTGTLPPARVASPRTYRTIAVTGSMRADLRQTNDRVRAVLAPYLGGQTTWFCGTIGTVDETVVEYLLSENQRVIAMGYHATDIGAEMRAMLERHDAPFIDAENEQVPDAPDAPNRRDLFFSTRADLVVVFWNGSTEGMTFRLLDWLRRQGRDHIVGFVRGSRSVSGS